MYGDNNARLGQLTRVWSDAPTLNADAAGTWDLLRYTGWNTVDMEGTTFTKLIHSKPLQTIRTRFRYAYQNLDFSQTYTGGVELNSSYCVGLVLPPAQGTLAYFNAQETRLSGKSLIFPAWTACMQIVFNAGQYRVVVLTTVDISTLPMLGSLYLSSCHVQSILFGSNTLANLQILSAGASRLGSFHISNTFTQLVALLQQAVNLRTILLSEGGFSETDLRDLVAALWGNRASRPTSGTRTFDISNASGTGYYYPANHPSFPAPAPPVIANASVIFKATRDKPLDLIALGWSVTWGGVSMTTARQSATTLRLTYTSTVGNTDAIDLWAVGDTVKVTSSTNATVLPLGNYRIAATLPGGKVWDLEALPGNTVLNVPVGYTSARAFVDML